jgi:hypothetical protein
MSCRRICRELLWQTRFGELGPGSEPHLEHLTDCRACRDELGFDRALVRQLRTALAERIEGASPSAHAWEGVLARMANPEPRPSRWRGWSVGLVARLRVGSAVAGSALAILVALNLEIVPVRPTDALHDGAAGIPATAPARPFHLADGFPQAAASAPYALGTTGSADEADAPSMELGVVTLWPQQAENLPLRGSATDVAPAEQPEPPTPEPTLEHVTSPLFVRLVPADAAVIGGTIEPAEKPAPEEPAPEPTPFEPGAPS